MGEMQIHKRALSITFPARIRLNKGPLKYLMVNTKSGFKDSLLEVNFKPYDFHIAFSLLGLETIIGKPHKQTVKITIIHRKDKVTQKEPAETWVLNNLNKISSSIKWIYTGSQIIDGRLAAQKSGSIIALENDLSALINIEPGKSGRQAWSANHSKVPKPGTLVIVVIKIIDT